METPYIGVQGSFDPKTNESQTTSVSVMTDKRVIHKIDLSQMSVKEAERMIKFVQGEREAQKALANVDPEFAKEFEDTLYQL